MSSSGSESEAGSSVEGEDSYRDGTPEELAVIPNKFWSLSKIEPDLQNGGTRVHFELFPCKYDALETKWCWVRGWIGSSPTTSDERSPACRFSDMTHEGTYDGRNYIYCTIAVVNMNNGPYSTWMTVHNRSFW